jgi:hypothetical protein
VVGGGVAAAAAAVVAATASFLARIMYRMVANFNGSLLAPYAQLGRGGCFL